MELIRKRLTAHVDSITIIQQWSTGHLIALTHSQIAFVSE